MSSRGLLLLLLLASPAAEVVAQASGTWGATGGTISPSGLFTPGATAGPARVIFAHKGFADTSEVTLTPAAGCQPTATHLCPGDNLQAKVTAQPSGTAFTLGAGVFRLQEVTPKSGQRFVGLGATRTILSGAKLLSGWAAAAAGGRWYVDGQMQSAEHKAGWQCDPAKPLCYESEMLWVNGAASLRVATLAELGPGRWYFDEAADRITLAEDPAGKQVETSVAERAFAGSATGVTITGLRVEKYANSNGYGAIGWQSSGTGWTIRNVVAVGNHGVGIKAFAGWQVLGSRADSNGQMGYACTGRGRPIVFDSDTFAVNNTNGNTAGLAGEAGGGKCTRSDSLTIRNTFSHHNKGPGLWTDINNTNTRYENNRVEDNDWRGIFHEISYRAWIVNNVIRRNGFKLPFLQPGACDGAGIYVSNSPDVEVAGNTVEDNKHGICGREDDRGSGDYGPHHIVNLWVHDNTVKQTDGGIAAGISLNNDPTAAPYSTAANNRWTRNTYRLGSGTRFRWTGNQDYSWDPWRAAGQDADGSQVGQ